MNKLLREQTAEISHFLIVSNFERRRRKIERRNLEKRKEEAGTDRRSTPHLALVLTAGVVRMCDIYRIRNWLSVMDLALNRLLSYFGLGLNPIGPTVDYHGLRQPYYLQLDEALDRMQVKHHDAWEVVTNKGKYSHFLSK